MEFDTQIICLTADFYRDYDSKLYPEILEKYTRPYNCLIVDTHKGYYICVPYRSYINHRYAYKFKSSKRSIQCRSGIDYSKMVIVTKKNYISEKSGIVDQDEYRETMQNIDRIVHESVAYLEDYIAYKKEEQNRISREEFRRRYSMSTLPYFDKELGL